MKKLITLLLTLLMLIVTSVGFTGCFDTETESTKYELIG